MRKHGAAYETNRTIGQLRNFPEECEAGTPLSKQSCVGELQQCCELGQVAVDLWKVCANLSRKGLFPGCSVLLVDS